jgi:hypothetical protein
VGLLLIENPSWSALSSLPFTFFHPTLCWPAYHPS